MLELNEIFQEVVYITNDGFQFLVPLHVNESMQDYRFEFVFGRTDLITDKQIICSENDNRSSSPVVFV